MKYISIFAFLFLNVNVFSQEVKKDTTKINQITDIMEWTKDENHAFIQNCLKNAQTNMSKKQAFEYCSCMLIKVTNKYPSPKKATKLTAEDIKNMALECLKKEH
ncbi:hypothetical protein [Flavobacterium sp.]|uniref:hypothetical protein n=1 Tax=Flavobacterium sp. TaxID=239 RepID=UPI00374CC87B